MRATTKAVVVLCVCVSVVGCFSKYKSRLGPQHITWQTSPVAGAARYVTIGLEHDDGFFMVLAPADSVKYNPATGAGTSPSTTPSPIYLPEIVLQAGWLYATGDRPRVGTNIIIAQAEGSSFIVQRQTGFDRVILIQSHDGKPCRVSSDTDHRDVAPGQYIDCAGTSSASVTWTGPYDVAGSAAEADVSSIISTVAAIRQTRHVP
jgi:hypothetical protein